MAPTDKDKTTLHPRDLVTLHHQHHLLLEPEILVTGTFIQHKHKVVLVEMVLIRRLQQLHRRSLTGFLFVTLR